MEETSKSEAEIRQICEKSEQVLRIFGTLWDKRLEALTKYFRKRYGFGFLFWQGKSGTAEEVNLAFVTLSSELNGINAREQKVLNLIKAGLSDIILTLENAYSESKQVHQRLAEEIGQQMPGLTKFEGEELYLLSLVRRYREVVKRQEEILALERDLIQHQTDEKWRLYLIRLESFAAEMKQVVKGYEGVRRRKKKYLNEIQKSVEDLRNFSLRKQATAYIGPSVVSAIVRVFGANIVSQGILMSFGKVNFWEFTSLTSILVTGINFTDYYFGWATKWSNKIARTLKIAK